MSINSETYHLKTCKKLIAEKLSLNPNSLTQRDFEFLNKVIFDKTKINLSTTTLRRLWSAEYSALPQVKTLDALALFLDFDNWHKFKMTNNSKSGLFNPLLIFNWKLMVTIFPACLGFWALTSMYADESIGEVSLIPQELIHEGVPATIGFKYDVSNAGNRDIFIQLSWNPNEKTLLNPENNFYTGTYFYPDFHQSKLLFEDQVIASENVYITTIGWHGILMKTGLDPLPIYILNNDFEFNERLSMGGELIEKYHLIPGNIYFPVFTLANQKLEGLNADSMNISATIQSLKTSQDLLCPKCNIIIKAENENANIPISLSGCYGETEIHFSDIKLSGKTNDLSLLSSELINNSIPVSINTKNHKLIIKVGNNETFVLPYHANMGRLKVIKFVFAGYGEVSNIQIGNDEFDLNMGEFKSPI